MRIALIANPASGNGSDPESLATTMRRHGADVRPCDGPEDAAASDPERLAVAGGDGTLGMVAELAATGERTRPMELGRLADGQPFVNVASAGLASAAARRAEPHKARFGPLAYGLGAIKAAASEQPLACTVTADGEPVFDGRAWQAIVAVTGAFGGGAEIGAADPDDGVLDATVLPAGSRLGLARRAWGMRRGTIAEQSDVCHARGAVVEVSLPPGTELNVDGEVADGGLECVTVERGAFELVVG